MFVRFEHTSGHDGRRLIGMLAIFTYANRTIFRSYLFSKMVYSSINLIGFALVIIRVHYVDEIWNATCLMFSFHFSKPATVLDKFFHAVY